MPIFPLTLHKTYLEQGFFNVTVDYDKYVKQSEGLVELVLLFDGKEQRVEATINRSANQNGTARIMGGTRLRDWFLDYFDVGAKIAVDLSSQNEIRVRRA